jgi:nitrous oxide reductase
MKNLIAVFALIAIASVSVFAQKLTPYVDYKGHIHYEKKQIGSLSSKGGFDQSGKPVTKIDVSGNIVDMNGKTLGKVPKGSTFVYYFNEKPENYIIGKASHSGMCKVKNEKGELIMLLHNNYKQQGACAIHCFYENKCMPSQK